MAKQHSGKQAGIPKKSMPSFIIKRLCEGSFILILTGALFVLLSLFTYSTNDPGWSHASRSGMSVSNSGDKLVRILPMRFILHLDILLSYYQ
ncbi:DNA translocase FtsK 4TM domain-containing protein [Legionella pneumophila]|nr:DNA translocase FtsK 4TM domain-containing protein [Legionella pneumophila]